MKKVKKVAAAVLAASILMTSPALAAEQPAPVAQESVREKGGAAVQLLPKTYYGCNMLVILPKGNIGEYVRSLNYTGIQKAYSNSENMKVKIKFPKFNFKQKNKLVSHLKTMGLESAFDSRNADFTGIADRSEGFNLFVSDISQECFISVDEEGTDAAALTSVDLAGVPCPRKTPLPSSI